MSGALPTVCMEEHHGTQIHRLQAFPERRKCSVAISADTVDEVVEAAVEHAVAVHKHQDSPQLRQQIRSCIKEGTPNP